MSNIDYLYHRWPVTSLTLKHVLSKIAFDPSFQRLASWKSLAANNFIKNVIVGFAPTPIIVANLKKCLELCPEGSEDYEYFNKFIKLGFEYLSIDGNNRTTAIRRYLGNELNIPLGILSVQNIKPMKIDKTNSSFESHPIELKQYIEKNVTITVCEYIMSTRKEATQLFKNVNEGSPFKAQEGRNCQLVAMADEIRKISSKYEKNNKFFKNNINYVFDELMAKCAVIFAFGPAHGVTQSDMNTAYTDSSIVYNSWVRKPGINGHQLVTQANELAKLYEGVKMNPSAFINLFITLQMIHESGKRIIDNKKFFKWFMETESQRIGSKDTLYASDKGNYTYSMLCGTSGKNDLVGRAKAIQKDLKTCKSIENQVEKDPNRIFSKTQRYEAWELQKGKTPTGEEIPESEIYDTEKWHADHIFPFSLGGLTTKNNCQLIRKEDNLYKGIRSI